MKTDFVWQTAFDMIDLAEENDSPYLNRTSFFIIYLRYNHMAFTGDFI